ncbi:protein SHQ1 homolog [Mercenaria mercenaria]|uniref:protein SHQ1 homolog n=1 Tax=Mercenaria mercenaria TaxID=6596 RepID=UPI00234EF00C|nr:protein SHQ1 homolog [Mercenaria mercenaria]XP_053377705.1 protein SHQ1 homolog [Mercenaria mercenaria]
MLTPAFELRQDRDFLTVIIKAPFAKVAETEIFIEEDDFKFFSKPYFLRLTLPGKIVEDGREKADYNADNGEFTVVVPKQTPGEHFEGLDMLTKLLEAKGKTPAASSLIEVLHDDTVEGSDEGENEEEFDWRVDQVPYKEQPTLIGAPKYGFANQKSGVFARLQEDMVCIVDCSDPDTLSVAERREQRIQAEVDKFDEDHYIADLYEDDLLKPLLDFRPHWYEEVELVDGGTPVDMTVELTADEKEIMRKLPRKEYILDSAEETMVYLGLVDILYAYCYNHRTTEGENNCESGWTICKISSTLSWLEVFSSLEEVLRSCYRRCLCYPLYRHWKLNQAIQQDVVHILQLGRRSVLKALLEVRNILMDQECRYVLNDLYITDYCVWIQSISEKRLQSLSETISKWKISKDDIGLNLPELEKLAQHSMQSEESEEVENLTEKFSGIHVDKSNGSDTESESDESDTESDSDVTDSDDLSSENDDGNDETKSDVIEKISDVTERAKDKIECDNLNVIGKNDIKSCNEIRTETDDIGKDSVVTKCATDLTFVSDSSLAEEIEGSSTVIENITFENSAEKISNTEISETKDTTKKKRCALVEEIN